MANRDNALGFIPHLEGSSAKPRIARRTLAATTKCYPGQPLKLSSGLLTPITGADDVWAAVSIGYADSASTSPVDQKALVIENLDEVVFRVQCDGAVAESHIGQYMKPSIVAADTSLKVARNEAAYSTLSATVGKTGTDAGRVLQLLGKVEEPDNAWGADCDVLVAYRRNLDAA